jgi:hypothetical protein
MVIKLERDQHGEQASHAPARGHQVMQQSVIGLLIQQPEGIR